jgi:hypothetical protein
MTNLSASNASLISPTHEAALTDGPTNLIFKHLRHFDIRLDGVAKKLNIVLDRVRSLEGQFSVMKSDLALM